MYRIYLEHPHCSLISSGHRRNKNRSVSDSAVVSTSKAGSNTLKGLPFGHVSPQTVNSENAED